MIKDASPLVQTLLGGLLTWFVTLLGAVACALAGPLVTASADRRRKQKLELFLDGSLGLSAGVMVAASFWSLLLPAIELSATMLGKDYEKIAFAPPALGFLLGALFMGLAEHYFPVEWFPAETSTKPDSRPVGQVGQDDVERPGLRRRHVSSERRPLEKERGPQTYRMSRRLWMMIVAITLHNVPEGAAVGVGFASAEGSAEAFDSAKALAIGIAIQNFPEGLAVSLPLRASGTSFWRSVWYGQISGLVEPIAGLVACLFVQVFRALQPVSLGFAAGAMIFVVFDDIIPETRLKDNGRFSSAMAMLGFVIMMALDVSTS